MRAYQGTGHWHWYDMSVPVRRWYINRFNEISEKDKSIQTKEVPLTMQEKAKLIGKPPVNNDKSSKPPIHNMLSPMRNKGK